MPDFAALEAAGWALTEAGVAAALPVSSAGSVGIPDRVEWDGQPVLTTEQLARSFGASSDNIYQNYKRNRNRFKEGVHYHCLTGSNIDDFRLCPTLGQMQISPKTRTLYVWTKLGAARHSKTLDTDRAWDVFVDATERNYFERQAPSPAFEIPKTHAGAQGLAAEQAKARA